MQLDALKAANAKRCDAVLVLQAAEFTLYGSAPSATPTLPTHPRSEIVRGLSQRPSRKLAGVLVPATTGNKTTRAAAAIPTPATTARLTRMPSE